MTLAYYIREALTGNPLTTLRRARRLIARKRHEARERRELIRRPAYRAGTENITLQTYLAPLPQELLERARDRAREAVQHYLDHRFDLLGSGWCDAGCAALPPGLEGHRYDMQGPDRKPGRFNRAETRSADQDRAAALWAMLDDGHSPIDWQRDLRSGYRWTALLPGRDLRYGDVPGADIKMPWELGRCHYLVSYAVTYAAWSYGKPAVGNDVAEPCLSDFRNSILDFLATNPPGFGAQWACAMDVSIRIVNWLVAWDIFCSHGASFDPEFDKAFSIAVAEHADFILRNLEWNPDLRGNHYLCDLMGLVFCGAYMGKSPLSDRCLAYGYEMLMKELMLQFHDDGPNFEASTSYHRLSTEAALQTLALIHRIGPARLLRAFSDERKILDSLPGAGDWSHLETLAHGPDHLAIPDAIRDRMVGACSFSQSITQPDGRDPQIGDNDNGRVLKLDPAVVTSGNGLPEEDFSDHAHLRAAFQAAGIPDAKLAADGAWLDEAVIRAYLNGDALFDGNDRNQPRTGLVSKFPRPGYYIYNFPRMWLTVRCGENGQNDFGGHCHNDQLSIVAWFGERPFFVDPGTYLYTPLPSRRLQFRATSMHNTLSVEGLEQNRAATDSLFRLSNDAHATTKQVSDTVFEGEHTGFGAPHRRGIEFQNDGFTVTDHCDLPGRDRHIHLHLHPSVKVTEQSESELILSNDGVSIRLDTEGPGQWMPSESQFSEAYGRIQPSTVLSLEVTGATARWSAKIRED